MCSKWTTKAYWFFFFNCQNSDMQNPPSHFQCCIPKRMTCRITTDLSSRDNGALPLYSVCACVSLHACVCVFPWLVFLMGPRWVRRQATLPFGFDMWASSQPVPGHCTTPFLLILTPHKSYHPAFFLPNPITVLFPCFNSVLFKYKAMTHFLRPNNASNVIIILDVITSETSSKTK